MKYQRGIQVSLRERYLRLYKTRHHVYAREARYFTTFIHQTPALKAIVDSLATVDPEFDVDQWIEKQFTWQSYDFPETEHGRAKVVWRLLERLADGSLDPISVAGSFSHDSNFNASLRDMTESAIEPLVQYFEECLGTDSDILYIIERLKRRIEVFDRKELYAAYNADTRHGEDTYDRYIRRYLFDQGVDNVLSTPRSASGEADIVAELDGDDPLVEETKLYDGTACNVAYIGKGLNQAVQYAQDHGKSTAYLLVVNLSDQNLELPTDEEPSDWPPRLHTSGVTVHMVVIRARPLPSASTRRKQKTLSIPREELIRPQAV